MIYFVVGLLIILGVWTVLLWKDEMKKLDKKYTDTRPSYNRSHMFPIEKDGQEETKQEVEHKQKIKIK